MPTFSSLTSADDLDQTELAGSLTEGDSQSSTGHRDTDESYDVVTYRNPNPNPNRNPNPNPG